MIRYFCIIFQDARINGSLKTIANYGVVLAVQSCRDLTGKVAIAAVFIPSLQEATGLLEKRLRRICSICEERQALAERDRSLSQRESSLHVCQHSYFQVPFACVCVCVCMFCTCVCVGTKLGRLTCALKGCCCGESNLSNVTSCKYTTIHVHVLGNI